MSPLVAIVVLQCVVLVMVVFALVGLQQNLRRLEQRIGRTSPQPGRPDDFSRLRPTGDAAFTCVLLASNHCPVCHSVMPTFVGLADPDSGVDLLVLSRAPLTDYPREGVRTIVDPGLFDAIDRGWQPAIAVVDRDAELLAVRPAGSQDAVRSVVEEAVKRSRSAQDRG